MSNVLSLNKEATAIRGNRLHATAKYLSRLTRLLCSWSVTPTIAHHRRSLLSFDIFHAISYKIKEAYKASANALSLPK